MTKHHLAALRCADGSFSVAYLFAHQKPAGARQAYDDLIAIAHQDYPQCSYAITASGIAVNVAGEKILPEHERIASCSYDFSLLKTGWRYSSQGYFVHPIPIGALAEAAHGAIMVLISNGGIPQFYNHPSITETKLAEDMRAIGAEMSVSTEALIATATALLPIFRRIGKWAEEPQGED